MERIRDLLPFVDVLPDVLGDLGLTWDSPRSELEAVRALPGAADAIAAELVRALLLLPDQRLGDQFPALTECCRQPVEPLLRTLRAQNVATREGILAIGDLSQHSPASLLALRNVGESTVEDFLDAVSRAALFGGDGAELVASPVRPVQALYGELRDLLPLLGALPPAADALGLTLFSKASELQHHDVVAPNVVMLMEQLCETVLEHYADRTLVGQLPGLRERLTDPLLPLVSERRTQNICTREGIVTVGELARRTPADLLDLRHAGQKTVRDLLHAALTAALFPSKAGEDHPTELPTPSEAGSDPVRSPAPTRTTDALDALGVFAAWAADCGLATLGAAFGAPNLDTPQDIAATWDQFAALDPTTIADPRLVNRRTPELVEELLTALPPNHLHVFTVRTLCLGTPPTLEQIGNHLGVTRERIRQIQVQAEQRIDLALRARSLRPLLWRAHLVAATLGTCAPHDDVLVTSAVDVAVGESSEPAQRGMCRLVLLWLAGPYRSRGAWLENARTPVPQPRDLERLADGYGLLTVAEAHAWLAEYGISSDFRDVWLERAARLRRFDDRFAVWSGSVVDKCVSLLALHGRPASAEWLVEQVAEGHSVRGVRARFFEDSRLIRINRSEWALPAWGHEEYAGIAAEIAERIEASGGRVELNAVVDGISRQFDVRAGSVRIYAEAPMFVIEDGWVRLRGAEEPYSVSATVASTRGLFQPTATHLTLLVPVDSELLRGSGRPCPQALASALGVVPGERRTLTWPGGGLLVSWPVTAAFGPALGSLRDLAGSVSATRGDTLRLDVDLAAGSIRATRVADDVTVPPLHRLEAMTGLDGLTEADALVRVAAAIGVDGAELRRQLLDRGDTAVADLLPRREVDSGLASALAELGHVLGVAATTRD